jgi:hypothetical protein
MNYHRTSGHITRWQKGEWISLSRSGDSQLFVFTLAHERYKDRDRYTIPSLLLLHPSNIQRKSKRAMTGFLMADSLRRSGHSRRRQNKGIDIDILNPSKTIPKAYTSERTELFILEYLFWLLYTKCTSTFVICYNRPYSAQECVGVCLFIPCMFITFRLF